MHPATRDNTGPADIDLVNSSSARPGYAVLLGPDARSLRRRSPEPVAAGPAEVARDAVELLAGGRLDRVR